VLWITVENWSGEMGWEGADGFPQVFHKPLWMKKSLVSQEFRPLFHIYTGPISNGILLI
jgi:hypothetical protein